MGVGLNSALARISSGSSCVVFFFFSPLKLYICGSYSIICTYGHDNLAFKLRSVLDETWR